LSNSQSPNQSYKNQTLWKNWRKSRKKQAKLPNRTYQIFPQFVEEAKALLMLISYNNRRKMPSRRGPSKSLMILRLIKRRRSQQMMADPWLIFLKKKESKQRRLWQKSNLP
jgi:adenine-specific DNA methylase